MNFKEWLILEIGDMPIETRKGSQLLQNPAMGVAMYVLYRQAYDSIGSSWSYQEWTRPSSGGTRAPAWMFCGVFPDDSELSNIQHQYGKEDQIADELVKNPQLFKRCGGLSYRDDKEGIIKLTGMWGQNGIAKMRSAANIIHLANENGKEIFTGADSALKELIQSAETKMPKFFDRGLVPSSTLGLSTPPKELIPFLYNVIIANPAASSGGTWTGYNADTGALKINLSGTGEREKFIYGNQNMWRNNINKALAKSGVNSASLTMAKLALKTGGIVARMAASKINKILQSKFPGATEIPVTGLIWLLNQL